MRKLLSLTILLVLTYNLHAQFSTKQLQVRFGYNLHNVAPRSVNQLIDAYNTSRYPSEISKNLPSINWATGFVFGANYAFREDMIFYGVFKSRRQFIESPSTNFDMYRQYMFRSQTLELGMVLPLREEGFFNHFAGGGIWVGVMEAHTKWSHQPGYHGSRTMFHIDNSGVWGMSFCYEAQFRLHPNLRLFIRPVAQFALPSPIRRLSEFMDPIVDNLGHVTYGPGAGEKYDKATFNGIGIEGGLLFLLPEF